MSSVWDLDYTTLKGQVTNVTKRKSNSTTTGAASMVMSALLSYNPTGLTFINTAAGNAYTNADDYLVRISRGLAKLDLAGIASVADTRSAHLVQSRITKLVSRVPKTVLWILVTANSVYVVIAIALAVLALWVTSDNCDVSQVRIRLSVVGLASQLLEGPVSERAVKDDKELFENQSANYSEQKKVKVTITEEGGAAFEVAE